MSTENVSYVKGLPLRDAYEGELVALDLEMFSQSEGRLHRPHGTFACLSVSFERGLDGTDLAQHNYLIEEVHDLRELLHRIRLGKWVFHNAGYDIRQLRRFVDIPQRSVWDTMLIEAGLFSGWYDSYGLADLYRRWTGNVISKELQSEFGKVSTLSDQLRAYAIRDSRSTLEIAVAQNAYISSQGFSIKHYSLIDEPCMWAIMDMSPARIDVDGWLKLAEFHEAEGLRIQEELGFNVYSHTQTKAALKSAGIIVRSTNRKDVLGPTTRKLRAEGKNTGADYLQKVIDARVFRKAASTYGKEWVDQHVEEGGLVYGDFWTIGARSSRMACSNPNLQNIPTRELPIFRKLFISRFDKGVIHVADCWQQEVCILAWFSEDKNLVAALRERRDLHQETADDFRLSRRDGKDINLGLGYGMSAQGLAKRTGISLNEAEAGITLRKQRYPDVMAWGDRQRKNAFAQDFVETSTGRRLWINRYDRQWERHAINLPIQGTAADHTKLWFVLCHQFSRSERIPFRIPLVVHDELVADVPLGENEQWKGLLASTGALSGKEVVPGMDMSIGVQVGESWGAKT